jgi:hypothetical protein
MGLDLIPPLPVDDGFVLPTVDGAFVLNLAYIYMIAQKLVEGTPGESCSIGLCINPFRS